MKTIAVKKPDLKEVASINKKNNAILRKARKEIKEMLKAAK